MKHIFILTLVYLLSSFPGLSQDIKQASSLKSYKGEQGEWLQKKGNLVVAQKGYFLLQVNKDVLVLPKTMKDKSKQIASEFLSSGHSTGLKSEMITVFGWNIKEGSTLKLGEVKSIVASGGGSDI